MTDLRIICASDSLLSGTSDAFISFMSGQSEISLFIFNATVTAADLDSKHV